MEQCKLKNPMRFSRDGVSLAVGAFNGECASRAKFQVAQPQRGFAPFLARPLRSKSLEIYMYFGEIDNLLIDAASGLLVKRYRPYM